MKRTLLLVTAFGLAFCRLQALGAASANAADVVTDDAIAAGGSPVAKANVDAQAPHSAKTGASRDAATKASEEDGGSAPQGTPGQAAAAQPVTPTVAGPAATTEPTPAVKHAPHLAASDMDDLQDQLNKMQDQYDDQQAALRRLEGTIENMRSQAEDRSQNEGAQTGGVESLRPANPDLYGLEDPLGFTKDDRPLIWRKLKMLINLDVEYASIYNTDPASKKGVDIGNGNNPDYISPALPDGYAGFYFKHIDLHFKYHFDEHMFAKLDTNISAVELDDVGIGWQDLPFPPLTSGWGDLTYSVFLGQRRQSFGIEQQTDSRFLIFPNRAMMYGGHNPFANAATPTRNPFDFYYPATTGNADINNLIAELAYERVMGLFVFQACDLGWMSYSLAFNWVNDESESSVDGTGTDSLKLGFPLKYAGSQDMAEIGRVGVEPRFLERLLPFGTILKLGASAFHDPENTAYLTSQSRSENWSDTQGLDAYLVTSREFLFLQSEYVKRDQYGPAFFPGAGGTYSAANVYGGLQGRAESWYVTAGLQPWRLFDPEAPKVELLARYDTFYYDDMAPWLQQALTPYTGNYDAITVALKYTYRGNCHTSINDTTYGLNNDFSATGPTELLQLEQQVTF